MKWGEMVWSAVIQEQTEDKITWIHNTVEYENFIKTDHHYVYWFLWVVYSMAYMPP